MNLFSEIRANNYNKYYWLCDPVLAKWIVDILSAYGNSIIDIGCGNGYMFEFYMPIFREIAGIEPSLSFSNQLNTMVEGKSIHIVPAKVENIPFKDNSYDIAFSKSSLHHFEDVNRGIKEMQRVSNKAVAIMEVVAPSSSCLPFLRDLLTKKEQGRDIGSIYTIESLRNVVEAAYFSNVYHMLFDQYIDIGIWLKYSDLEETLKKELYNFIITMDDKTAVQMQLHKREGRYVMLRRMCLCIGIK